jgi:hypothetical protein
MTTLAILVLNTAAIYAEKMDYIIGFLESLQ